jgi:hypothetical protein
VLFSCNGRLAGQVLCFEAFSCGIAPSARQLNLSDERRQHEYSETNLSVLASALRAAADAPRQAMTCSGGTFEQQQPGALRIEAKNIGVGDLWLTKLRSPVLVFRPPVSELLIAGKRQHIMTSPTRFD